jgi:hypothetical protein
MRLENATHLSTINISSDRIIQWMNVIRRNSGETQHRLLENFWASQLRSKAWLINVLKSLKLPENGEVYIFGGWYGILASLLKDNFLYKNIYSIDVDRECEKIGLLLDNRINFITTDMKHFVFNESSNPKLIINTSTEHVSQDTFDTWLKNMPKDVPIILQGNDYFECKEHIRCTNSLEEFLIKGSLDKILYMGTLDCAQFNRFMVIGYKHAY